MKIIRNIRIMKIGIDASRAFSRERTGIEEYSYQVLKHLRDKLDGHQVVLYITSCEINEIRKTDWIPKDWKIKIIKWPRFWTQGGLSLEMLLHPVEVLFVPSHVVPLIHPVKTVMTVHGLEYEMMPEAYSVWARLYMRLSIKLSCRAAGRIIAVSENTKKDLMRLYKIPAEKIRVVYEGANKNFKFEILNLKSNQNDKILNYKPYLLFVGRLEKRKNIEGIIEAFKILKEKHKIPHKLVLAGNPSFGYKDLKFRIENSFQISNFKFQIIELGYVDEATKWQLLSQADVFLFPTFYEGFGLPILEAQSAGTPVVTSNVSSLPEVAGEAAAYCDPTEPISIVEAVQSILSDPARKKDLVEKGLENLERFSWEKCATEIARVML